MIGERTQEGWQLRLKIRDPGRFVGAVFLTVWLCIWAIGEAFALWILIKGAIALLTGAPPDPGRQPLEVGPAVMVGAFLLLWLALWTLGGIAAIGELLRLLWGEDRLTVTGGRLKVTWVRGPFRRTRVFDRDAIRRVTLLAPRDTLALETATQRVEMSRLGTRAERVEAVAELTRELGIVEARRDEGYRLPPQWEDLITPEGERALVPNLSNRKAQARVTTFLAMGVAAVTFLIARDAVREPVLFIPATMTLLLTIALAAGAVWLARGRMEWRIGSGRLTLRKRFGSSVRDVFEARRLLLDSSTDSDGDVWYTLYAVGEGEESAAPAVSALRPARPKNARAIARIMSQRPVMLDLAAWLARAAALKLEDRTTPEAQAADLVKLREMLEGSGRFGRWASKWLDRVGERKSSSG